MMSWLEGTPPRMHRPSASKSSAAGDWRKVLEPMLPQRCWRITRERIVAFESERDGAMPT
jgi:hypothetical protein